MNHRTELDGPDNFDISKSAMKELELVQFGRISQTSLLIPTRTRNYHDKTNLCMRGAGRPFTVITYQQLAIKCNVDPIILMRALALHTALSNAVHIGYCDYLASGHGQNCHNIR